MADDEPKPDPPADSLELVFRTTSDGKETKLRLKLGTKLSKAFKAGAHLEPAHTLLHDDAHRTTRWPATTVPASLLRCARHAPSLVNVPQ